MPGLVGGWIVRHLIIRGEDPKAIRIVDISPAKSKIDTEIDCVIADISKEDAVNAAFAKAWPDAVKDWPLSVFHTVAYINASERTADFLSKYVNVNVLGTQHVLAAAKTYGASCFISTSSGSISIKPPSFFALPPRDTIQFRPNAEPERLQSSLEAFGTCYAWSKAQAERMVRSANQAGFLTGCIRPGHAIYGEGVDNPSSLTWTYLQRGGAPTWLSNIVAHFVNAQNVSIGHLAYEDTILKGRHGGEAYCVTDGSPIRYGMFYDVLAQLSLTPVAFPKVPHILMLLLAHIVEYWILISHRYGILPPMNGELKAMQPSIFTMSSVHLIMDDTAAREEIGYKPAVTTLQGLAQAVRDWNERAARVGHDKANGIALEAKVLSEHA